MGMRKKSPSSFIHISRSWTTFNPDGSIKDFGLKTIKHKLSFAVWNDPKKNWDYLIVPCNCIICQEENRCPKQLQLFGSK
jgi:hypothetical protein